MLKVKQIGSLASTLVAVFLFSYTVSLSFASSKNYLQDQGYSIAKSEKLPVNPDAQSPFEEKEEEAGDEFQDSFSLLCIPAEALSFAANNNQYRVIHRSTHSVNEVSHIPIYLAKRS